MSHKQLAQEQRYQIYALKKAGVKDTEIANILQVHKSTVCRELSPEQISCWLKMNTRIRLSHE
jgi:IS30 family transposase